MKSAIVCTLLLSAGCYIEPAGRTWTGDRTLATSCDLGNGVTVTADGPVYCAAIAANWQQAHDAIVPKFTTEEEWQTLTRDTPITVVTRDRCLPGLPGCTYERTLMNGASFDWVPVSIEVNEHGVQLTHEALHAVSAWNNVPSGDHQGWDRNGYMDTADRAAESAYKITP